MKKTILLAVFAVLAALSMTGCHTTSESWYYIETPAGCATVDGTANTADCMQCTARLETYNSYYNYCMD